MCPPNPLLAVGLSTSIADGGGAHSAALKRAHAPLDPPSRPPGPTHNRRLLLTVAPTSNTTAHGCEDLATVLAMTPEQLEAALSRKFCGKNATVGPAFVQAARAMMDSDGDATVTCAEYAVVNMKGKVADLPSGGFFGPKELPTPTCNLDAKGKSYLASINKHLADLTAETVEVAKSNPAVAAKLAAKQSS